jgi:hypothetical protein
MKCTTVKYFRARGLDAREVLEATGQRPKWGHGARRDLKRIERQARHAFKDQQRAAQAAPPPPPQQQQPKRKAGRADEAATWKAAAATAPVPKVVAILARPAAVPTREARRRVARKAARRAEHEAKMSPSPPPGTNFDAFLDWALRVALPEDRLLTLWTRWW